MGVGSRRNRGAVQRKKLSRRLNDFFLAFSDEINDGYDHDGTRMIRIKRINTDF